MIGQCVNWMFIAAIPVCPACGLNGSQRHRLPPSLPQRPPSTNVTEITCIVRCPVCCQLRGLPGLPASVYELDSTAELEERIA